MAQTAFKAEVNPYAKEYYVPDYEPTEDDLLCAFKVTPREDVDMIEAAAAVAAESSTATWTEVWSREFVDIEHFKAKVYKIEGDIVYIAYPLDLFEAGSIPNIISSALGNVFGMKAVTGLRMEDMRVPLKLVETFKGPGFGIEGVRDMLGIHDRPLIGGTIKPKLGMSPKHQALVAYESLVGGMDAPKDDENLNSQTWTIFYDRARYVLEAVHKAEAETGERKGYFLNVTAPDAEEMIRRAEFVKANGGRFVMVDFLTVGFAALQTLRNHCERLGLAIHCHRAFHSLFTRPKNHGCDFRVMSKFARLVGVDHIHIGTAIGKLEGTRTELGERIETLTASHTRAGGGLLFDQPWGRLKSVFPVASGGLHPGHVPFLYESFGKDAILQFGGGAHGHPGGSRAGAKACRDAVEATIRGIPLEQAAKESPELRAALDLWKDVKF